MSNPLVTVALPVYNAESTIEQAVASILKQTYENWELLVLEDGSTDATFDVLRRFSDPRIKIVSDGTNKGLTVRLNQAIDLAAGKYLARMDADDLAFSFRLERQLDYLATHPQIDLLSGRAITKVNNVITGQLPFRQTHDEICANPWNGFYMPHPTWMGKTEWFRRHRYHVPEIKRAEDQELLLRSYPGSRFACLPEVILAYSVRPSISLKVNIRGRWSLLKAQSRIFLRRKQMLNFSLSVIFYLIKSLRDILIYLGWKNNKTLSADQIDQKECRALGLVLRT